MGAAAGAVKGAASGRWSCWRDSGRERQLAGR